MKGPALNNITACLFGILLFCASCKKEEKEPDKQLPSTFHWTPGKSDGVSADSTFCYPSITTIYAFKGGLANSIEINLSSFGPGTYSISPASGNALTFVSANVTYTASSGKVVIDNNTDGRLSGNFTTYFNDSTFTSLNGWYTDVEQR